MSSLQSETDGLETRFCELRVAAGENRRIRGTPIVFNSPSRIIGGRFREVIDPKAVDRTLRSGGEIFALFNHNWDQVLGNSKSGTLRLTKESRGLGSVIDPPDTDYANNLLKLMERGDVRGMSFRFVALDDAWDFSTTPPTRTVLDMEFPEISVVTNPAYESAVAAFRSLDAAVERVMDPAIVAMRAKLNAPLPWETRT